MTNIPRVCFVVSFEGLFQGMFRGSVSPKSNFPDLLKVSLTKKIQICSNKTKEHNYMRVKPASAANQILQDSAHPSQTINHVTILECNLHTQPFANITLS